jgi:hypothetical protein
VLVWSVVEAINSGLGEPLFLATRAHLEVAGMVAYLVRYCRRYLAREITAIDLQEQIDRLFLGRRMVFPEDGQSIPANEMAVSVLAMVDSVDFLAEDKAIRRVMRGQFREAYEWLSEFCHPNLQAMLGNHRLTPEGLEFLREPHLEENVVAMVLHHLQFSDFVFSSAFEVCIDLFRRPWPDEEAAN